MSNEWMHVGRVRVYQEAAGAAGFAQEHSATIADFKDLRTNRAAIRNPEAMLRDERLVQRQYEEPLDVVGPRSCEIDWETYLRGTGTALNAGVGAPPATPADALGRVLQAMWGGYASGQGSDAEAGCTTSLINVTGGHGTRFGGAANAPGRFVGVTLTGGVEVRPIAGISTDALTLWAVLSGAPSVGADILNSHTFFLMSDPTLTLQFIVRGNETHDIWWLLGLQGPPTFTFSPGELVKLGSTFKGPDWKHDDEVSVPLGAVLIGSADYATDDPGEPLPFVNSEVLFPDISGAGPFARTLVDISSISITPNWTWDALPSTSGVNGVRRYRLNPNRPAAGFELTMRFDKDSPGPEGEVYWDRRKNRTRHGLQVQVGKTAGSIAAVCLPNVQISNVVRTEVNGIVSQTITGKALEGEDFTDQTTELRVSPVLLGRL